MIKYVKLREETEMPCMVCGSDSRIFIVKNMKHTKQNSFYICEKCFKSFKKDMQEARVKEYTESDLSKILKQRVPD